LQAPRMGRHEKVAKGVQGHDVRRGLDGNTGHGWTPSPRVDRRDDMPMSAVSPSERQRRRQGKRRKAKKTKMATTWEQTLLDTMGAIEKGGYGPPPFVAALTVIRKITGAPSVDANRTVDPRTAFSIGEALLTALGFRSAGEGRYVLAELEAGAEIVRLRKADSLIEATIRRMKIKAEVERRRQAECMGQPANNCGCYRGG